MVRFIFSGVLSLNAKLSAGCANPSDTPPVCNIYLKIPYTCTVQCTVGSQADIQLFWVNVEISAGLLELVQALLPEFKTVFRLNFKQVLRKI